MPLTKKHKKKALKGGNKQLNGGKPCPTGSQKVCIKKGDLIKLLKKASVKTRKTKKVKLNKRKLQKTMRTSAERMPVTEEKKTTLLGSIFGAEEEPIKEDIKSVKEVAKPNVVEEKPNVVEEPIVEEEKPKESEEKPSFIESIFGSEEKKPEKKPEETQV
jgi:hypothetical protein